jgi:hypothetical protein
VTLPKVGDRVWLRPEDHVTRLEVGLQLRYTSLVPMHASGVDFPTGTLGAVTEAWDGTPSLPQDDPTAMRWATVLWKHPTLPKEAARVVYQSEEGSYWEVVPGAKAVTLFEEHDMDDDWVDDGYGDDR